MEMKLIQVGPVASVSFWFPGLVIAMAAHKDNFVLKEQHIIY